MARLLLASCLLASAAAFYLPGVSPRNYVEGERVKIRVNKLTSSKTLLPFGYYDLPFPKPVSGTREQPENLGEYLTGQQIENSPYRVLMLKDEYCKFLAYQTVTPANRKKFLDFIAQSYHVNFIADNLPSAAALNDMESKTQTTVYDVGYLLGRPRVHNGELLGVMLYNHIKITLSYHIPTGPDGGSPDKPGGRIVGFLVEPITVKHKYEGTWPAALKSAPKDPSEPYPEGMPTLTTCYETRSMPSLDSRREPLYIDRESSTEIIWTYDVEWRASKIEWASRWDLYLSMAGRYDDEVHWFSIINALLIVLFLTGMVAMIMVRSLHRDITRYNRVPTEAEREDEREETGWKLVHRDVFRPPPTFPMLFCVLTGSGMQLLYMSVTVLLFAAIGFLSPANRGSLMIALILLFVLMGVAAGYSSSRTYKFFKGKAWQQCTLLTALFYPGFCFVIFFVLNLFVWGEGSVRAVPFGSMLAVVALWFGISVPLVFLGAYLGYRTDAMEVPVKTTSNIPRPIPEQPWYMSTLVTALVGGVLPFGAVFVELFFILSSLWLNQYYYVFGFLLLVWIILIITCAEITIVLCYFQLCSENYHWWWRSFLTSGSSAFYVYLYSTYYYFTKVNALYFLTGVLYFTYMFLISFGFFLLTGVVGYFSCFWFICKIYASIKVD
jgi:transmembrane 9 superfamily protein 2/4